MEMGSVFLATSKSRIEEYLPPNFGQEIVIFPLSRDCDPIICSIAPFPYGDRHMETGIYTSLGNPHFHMVIPVSI
jgi:hypothetical protein